MLVANKVLATNEVDIFEGSNKSIEKSVKLKIKKLSKGQKLSKSEKLSKKPKIV